MTNICINTLSGIPASGKSTFCQKIQSEAKIFNVIHICYDDFIRLPDIASSSSSDTFLYFKSKQYKRQRFSLLWLIQQLIDGIKANSDFSKFRQAINSDFPHANFDVKAESSKKYYLLLIDDTMHYKSMRKEIRTLARDNELGHFVTFFHSTLDSAIDRNQNRKDVVDKKHLERMYAIFEAPTYEDGKILKINIDENHQIDNQFVESFALECINCPLKFVQLVNHPVIEQTTLHKVDLVLRKSVNRKMTNYQKGNISVDLRELAKLLCAKRCFVLKEIKMGRIDLPENLDDLSNFIDGCHS